MNRIKCVNRRCTNPDGSRVFTWEKVGVQVVNRIIPGSVSYVVECPFCGESNKVFVKVDTLPLTSSVLMHRVNAPGKKEVLNEIVAEIIKRLH